MNGTSYQVTPDEVSSAAATVAAKAADIKAQLDGLRTYIVNLEDVWQGIAQDTFQILMDEYRIYADMLHSALEDISSGLTGTYVNYTDSENANIQSLQRLHDELPSANLG